MSKRLKCLAAAAAIALAAPVPAIASPQVGKPAPKRTG